MLHTCLSSFGTCRPAELKRNRAVFGVGLVCPLPAEQHRHLESAWQTVYLHDFTFCDGVWRRRKRGALLRLKTRRLGKEGVVLLM